MVLFVLISWIGFAVILSISISHITTRLALSTQGKSLGSLNLRDFWLQETYKRTRLPSCLICLSVTLMARKKSSVGAGAVDCKDLFSCDNLLNENASIGRRGILTECYAIAERLVIPTIAYRNYLHNPLVCYG